MSPAESSEEWNYILDGDLGCSHVTKHWLKFPLVVALTASPISGSSVRGSNTEKSAENVGIFPLCHLVVFSWMKWCCKYCKYLSMLVLLSLLVLLAKLWLIFLVGVGKTTDPSAPIQQQTTPFIQNLTLKRDQAQCQGSLGFLVLGLRASEEDCHVSV